MNESGMGGEFQHPKGSKAQPIWENMAQKTESGETVFIEGLGEVYDGQYLPIPPHPRLNAIGKPLLDDKKLPIMCKCKKGVVAINRPLVGEAYVSVVCASGRKLKSEGQCFTKYTYRLK